MTIMCTGGELSGQAPAWSMCSYIACLLLSHGIQDWVSGVFSCIRE